MLPILIWDQRGGRAGVRALVAEEFWRIFGGDPGFWAGFADSSLALRAALKGPTPCLAAAAVLWLARVLEQGRSAGGAQDELGDRHAEEMLGWCRRKKKSAAGKADASFDTTRTELAIAE